MPILKMYTFIKDYKISLQFYIAIYIFFRLIFCKKLQLTRNCQIRLEKKAKKILYYQQSNLFGFAYKLRRMQ